MKIIRHLSPTGPAYASLQPDGSAREITGDLFGDFTVTDRVVTPGKLLAPVVPTNLPCIGLNYKKHAAESNSPLPPHPVLSTTNTAAVQNPGEPIEIPVKLASAKVDLPEPDSPTMPSVRPGVMLKFASLTATNSALLNQPRKPDLGTEYATRN